MTCILRQPSRAIVLACLALPAFAAFAADAPSLAIESEISLGNIAGRIDHLAFDPVRQRVYIAELGNDSVAIVDIAARRVVRTVAGFREPQGIGYDPATETVFVANGDGGEVRMFSGEDFAPLGSVELGDDADNVRIDSQSHRVYVGYGSGALAVIDGQSRKRMADLSLRAHPEGFQLDPEGSRIFANVPDVAEIAVLSRSSDRQVESWPTGELRANFPLTFDPRTDRILVVFRKPARLVAYDSQSGRAFGGSKACADSDDVFVDARRRRVYVICGEGVVETFDSMTYLLLDRIVTSPGSRTGLFVPELDRLLIAIRGSDGKPAALWILRPDPP